MAKSCVKQTFCHQNSGAVIWIWQMGNKQILIKILTQSSQFDKLMWNKQILIKILTQSSEFGNNSRGLQLVSGLPVKKVPSLRVALGTKARN